MRKIFNTFFALTVCLIGFLSINSAMAAEKTAQEKVEQWAATGMKTEQLLEKALKEGLSLEQAAKIITIVSISQGKPANEVAKEITFAAGKITVEAKSGESTEAQKAALAATVKTVSKAVAEGTVEAAVASGQDVAPAAQNASAGNTQGAVEAALLITGTTSQDLAEIVQAASQGSTEGAIDAANQTGHNQEGVVAQAASQGSVNGAAQAAQDNGIDADTLTDAANSGSQQAADDAGVSVEPTEPTTPTEPTPTEQPPVAETGVEEAFVETFGEETVPAQVAGDAASDPGKETTEEQQDMSPSQ